MFIIQHIVTLPKYGHCELNFRHPHITDIYPASRSLFSVVFVKLTGAREIDLCPGSKQTMLSMHHGYLANRHVRPCYYAGSLNDSGVTVNECARDSGLKSWSANNTGSMRFVSAVHDFGRFGRRLHQSLLRPRAESGRGLFSSRPSVQRIQRKRGLCLVC